MAQVTQVKVERGKINKKVPAWNVSIIRAAREKGATTTRKLLVRQVAVPEPHLEDARRKVANEFAEALGFVIDANVVSTAG